MNRRTVALTLAALATGLAAYWSPEPEAGVVQPAPRDPGKVNSGPQVSTPVPQRPSEGSLVLAVKPREAAAEPTAPAFPVVNWNPPPPPPPPPVAVVSAPPPVPEPVAPPLPFRLLGSMLDGGRQAVFLQLNDQNLVVRTGDSIAGQYKVVRVDETAMTLLHLPTNQQQTLSIGPSR